MINKHQRQKRNSGSFGVFVSLVNHDDLCVVFVDFPDSGFPNYGLLDADYDHQYYSSSGEIKRFSRNLKQTTEGEKNRRWWFHGMYFSIPSILRLKFLRSPQPLNITSVRDDCFSSSSPLFSFLMMMMIRVVMPSLLLLSLMLCLISSSFGTFLSVHSVQGLWLPPTELSWLTWGEQKREEVWNLQLQMMTTAKLLLVLFAVYQSRRRG